MGLMSEHMKLHGIHHKPHGQGAADPPIHTGHSSITAHCLLLGQNLFDATGNPLKVWI